MKVVQGLAWLYAKTLRLGMAARSGLKHGKTKDQLFMFHFLANRID
jgi:hypothetical protein